jgi:hypothetical protein
VAGDAARCCGARCLAGLSLPGSPHCCLFHRDAPGTSCNQHNVDGHEEKEPFPLGFPDCAAYHAFCQLVISECPHPISHVIFQGSSIMGVSWKAKAGEGGALRRKFRGSSDYDVALVSPKLLYFAAQQGIDIHRPFKLGEDDAKSLQLHRVLEECCAFVDREVNFRLFDDEKAAIDHVSASLVFRLTHDGRPSVYLLGSLVYEIDRKGEG